MDILRLIFDCDEFYRVFEPPLRALLLSDGKRHHHRKSTLSTRLVAYSYQEKKPSLNIHPDDLAALPATVFNLSYVELTLCYASIAATK